MNYLQVAITVKLKKSNHNNTTKKHKHEVLRMSCSVPVYLVEYYFVTMQVLYVVEEKLETTNR